MFVVRRFFRVAYATTDDDPTSGGRGPTPRKTTRVGDLGNEWRGGGVYRRVLVAQEQTKSRGQFELDESVSYDDATEILLKLKIAFQKLNATTRV